MPKHSAKGDFSYAKHDMLISEKGSFNQILGPFILCPHEVLDKKCVLNSIRVEITIPLFMS